MSHGFPIIHHSAARVIKLSMFFRVICQRQSTSSAGKPLTKHCDGEKETSKLPWWTQWWVHLLHGEESNVFHSPHRSLDFLSLTAHYGDLQKVCQIPDALLLLRLAKLVGLADTALRRVSLWVLTIGSKDAKGKCHVSPRSFEFSLMMFDG